MVFIRLMDYFSFQYVFEYLLLKFYQHGRQYQSVSFPCIERMRGVRYFKFYQRVLHTVFPNNGFLGLHRRL